MRSEEPSEFIDLWDKEYMEHGIVCHNCWEAIQKQERAEYYKLKEEGFWDEETIAIVEKQMV